MSEQRVREIGEFGLIDRLRASLPPEVMTRGDVILSIGDDAAVWRPPAGERVVVTTDTLIEDIHFRLDWTDWRSLGHKMLAVNLSDLAAMGAEPRIAVVSLGLTGAERVDDLVALYEGAGEIARQTGTAIAGGDIVRSPNGVSLNVTVLGSTRGGALLARSGARVGDLIAVTGTLGAAAAGLALLELPGDDVRRRTATAPALMAAHLRPEPRLDVAPLLLEHGASAAMDLSDGLFGDLPKLLHASGVAGRIAIEQLPVAAAVRALFPDRWRQLATRGGEDYELLFTIECDQFRTLQTAVAAIGATVTAIGEVIAGPPRLNVIDNAGVERPVEPGAFDHFGD